MTTLTQHKRAGGFILHEAPGNLSRDNGILAEGEVRQAGTVLMADGDRLVMHDGSEAAAAGILYAYADAADGDLPVTIVARQAEVGGELLEYPEDADDAIAAALDAIGINVRPALSGGSGGGGDVPNRALTLKGQPLTLNGKILTLGPS